MNCPNCGAQMPEGSLYCEKCGEDIHIVPDYEPELDHNIQQAIQNIADEIRKEEGAQNGAPEAGKAAEAGKTAEADQAAEAKKTAENKQDAKPKEAGQDGKSARKKRLRLLGAAAALALVAVLAVISLFQYFSVDYQTAAARECMDKKQYDRAIRHYGRAMELDGGNVDLKVELAEAYFHKNNKIEYEYLLRSIVKDANATKEQIEGAYGKMIAIYKSRGDYQEINDFLQASKNEAVLAAYQAYIAKEPEFSVIEGYYTTIQPLKLTSFGTGNIYYTLDGSEPSEDSLLYTTPILLEDGDYDVKAYYVNENGIYSNVVEKEYHIRIEELPVPEISVASGEYAAPLNIEVMDVGEEVYYTTDGTTPTLASSLYTAPIPMPLGRSHFKFIRIGNGRTSAVEERTYKLALDTDLTPERAEELVVSYKVETGKIRDASGYTGADGDRYLYQYQCVISMQQSGAYYVISENHQQNGAITNTGAYFAVDAYSGKLYKLLQEEGGYRLDEIT